MLEEWLYDSSVRRRASQSRCPHRWRSCYGPLMTHTIPILAIDPGSRDGAALLRSPSGQVEWWVWSWLKGKGGRYRVRTSAGPILERDTLYGVGHLLAKAVGPGGWLLLVEGLYAPPSRSVKARAQAQDVIVLAESTGMLMGPLIVCNPTGVLRPPATTWRSEVLHLPGGMNDKRAEEYAIQWSGRNGLTMPTGLTYAEEGALAEAYCMAHYAEAHAMEAA